MRLEGKVAWKRTFGLNDVATVPPGLGLQISGGSKTDINRYAEGYLAFADEISAQTLPPALGSL